MPFLELGSQWQNTTYCVYIH